MKTNEEAGRRWDFRFQIADFRLGRPGSLTCACPQQKVSLPRGLKPSGFWSVYAGLKARSSTVLEPVARCGTYRMVPRMVLDVSHGAGQQNAAHVIWRHLRHG